MSNLNQPAAPGEGPESLPTPSLPGNQPAQPGEGPEGLPTPSLPGNQPAQPGEGPEGLPTPSLPGPPTDSVRVCPAGYRSSVVRNNQTFGDLLLENDVSFNALRQANPTLPTTRLAPGTVYCAPPAGTRRLCANEGVTYILTPGESLTTLSQSFGSSPELFLRANPCLAPGDFVPGRVICLPRL